MNNKSVFLGLLVFGAGVGAGYFFGLKRAKAQYQSDLAEVKDFYMQRLLDNGVQEEGFVPPHLNEGEEDDEESEEYHEEMSEEYFNRLKAYSSATLVDNPKGRPITKYNKPPLEVVGHGLLLGEDQPEPDEPDDEDEDDYEEDEDLFAEEMAQRRYENQQSNRPYVIGQDEFEDGPENYDQQILYYYSEDRVLCDEDDSIVEDEEMLVGFDYEDVLDMQTTAWVRNDAIMTLYQINRLNQSYARDVAAIVETPNERQKRLSKRKMT